MSKKPVRQITLRHPSVALTKRLKAVAAERGASLNATVLDLLESAVGLHPRAEYLRRYVEWSEEEGQDLDSEIKAQRVVDLSTWKS